MDKSQVIFGNKMSDHDIQKANANKEKMAKKFGNDESVLYPYAFEDANVITDCFGAKNVVQGKHELPFPEGKYIVVGNIRMGFGHYRISMAMASCAHAMGYTPLWLDLLSFPDSTCTKIVNYQNNLYSTGSRLSQKSKAFNAVVWDPMNSEGFRKLSYNCSDQKTAELMAPIMQGLPKDIPFISTHAWCAQAAIHAGLTNVVSAVCDNWPMALHLAEGSIHTVQTESAYIGYKTLRGMDKKRDLKPIPSGQIEYVGHYVDHEIVQGIEYDTARRLNRVENDLPKTYLLTVGGAGAQKEFFEEVIKHLLPKVKEGKANLLVNFGDHTNVFEDMSKDMPEFYAMAIQHFNNYDETKAFFERYLKEELHGLHVFCDNDIFAAVYTTNLLMRLSDVLLTKPSELSFYPIPKLFIKHIGGHEVYGAIHSSELGDGTYECETARETCRMMDIMEEDHDLLTFLNNNILANHKNGLYNGAYKIIEILERNQSR